MFNICFMLIIAVNRSLSLLLQKCHRHKFHLEAIKFQTVDKKVLLRCISSEEYKQQNKMNAGERGGERRENEKHTGQTV